MNQRSIPRLRKEPLSGEALLHSNSSFRTNLRTESTALTGNRVNLKIPYRSQSADLLTQFALGALLLINDSRLPTPEFLALFNNRLEKEIKVSSVHIAVNHYLALSQGSKGSHHDSLPCPPLTAKNHYFLHC